MAKYYSGVSAYVKMALQVTETGTDINANTSSISWSLIAWFTGSSSTQWYSNDSHDISVTINGQTVFSRASSEKVKISIGTDHASESNPVTIASGTMSVAHNADGTKSIAASFSMAYKWVSYSWSASGTLALTTIARASQPSCITYPNTTQNIGKMGDEIVIHMNQASDSFTHTVRYTWYNLSGTISTNVKYNCKWTIPLDFASQIPNQTSGSGTIYCDTYQNGSLIGTKSVTWTVSVPSIPPKNLTVKTAEAASIPSNITGYVQSWSKLKITNTAAGQYGASIQKYEVSVDGKSYSGSTVTTSTIQTSGSVPITVTATDSRGQKTTVTVNATVQSYTTPTITGASAYRCSSSGTADASGAYICIKATGTLTSLNNQNGKTCTAYWKKATDSSWKSKTITMSSYNLNGSVIVDAATDSSYNVYVRLKDSFRQTDYYTSDVLSASAFIDILTASESDDTKKGLAIGKTAETEGAVDIGWNLIARKGFTWEGMVMTSFIPTVNITATYYSRVGNYVKIGHLAFVELFIQINVLSGTAPSDILITLPDALKFADNWWQVSRPVCDQWTGKHLGVIKTVQNTCQLKAYLLEGVGNSKYIANGCYVFFVQ